MFSQRFICSYYKESHVLGLSYFRIEDKTDENLTQLSIIYLTIINEAFVSNSNTVSCALIQKPQPFMFLTLQINLVLSEPCSNAFLFFFQRWPEGAD